MKLDIPPHKKRCAKCKYSVKLQSTVLCDYLEKTGHRKKCDAKHVQNLNQEEKEKNLKQKEEQQKSKEKSVKF